MTFVLGMIGLIGMVFGAAVTITAKSAIHEILGSLGVGFGALILAVAVLIDRVTEGNALLLRLVEKPAAAKD